MLRIAVCDDDIADCDRIYGFVQDYINRNDLVADVRKYTHPDLMLTESVFFHPNIYILDIVMPMLTGLEAAKEVRWTQKNAQIIFATSEKSYALEAYDVSPINYILKPVDKNKLEQSLNRAISNIGPEDEQSITVKIKGGFATIRICDIMYVDCSNHKVTFHLLSNDPIATPTLRIGFAEYVEELLPTDMFLRCHESIVVNIAAIDKLVKYEIALRNKEIIPVSRNRYDEIASAYIDYRL
jgi:DNA-binding LytR/AlgR family response regulator